MTPARGRLALLLAAVLVLAASGIVPLHRAHEHGSSPSCTVCIGAGSLVAHAVAASSLPRDDAARMRPAPSRAPSTHSPRRARSSRPRAPPQHV